MDNLNLYHEFSNESSKWENYATTWRVRAPFRKILFLKKEDTCTLLIHGLERKIDALPQFHLEAINLIKRVLQFRFKKQEGQKKNFEIPNVRVLRAYGIWWSEGSLLNLIKLAC